MRRSKTLSSPGILRDSGKEAKTLHPDPVSRPNQAAAGEPAVEARVIPCDSLPKLIVMTPPVRTEHEIEGEQRARRDERLDVTAIPYRPCPDIPVSGLKRVPERYDGNARRPCSALQRRERDADVLNRVALETIVKIEWFQHPSIQLDVAKMQVGVDKP